MENEVELAYLAGFVDGEGCISGGKSGTQYHVMFYVTQLNPEPLFALQRMFGGSIARKPDKRGFRSTIAWQISARQAMTALEALRPYLRVKAEEADLAIALQQRLSYAQAPSREEELAGREEVYLALKAIKQRSYEHVALPETAPHVPERLGGKRIKQVRKPPKPKSPKKVRTKVAVPVRGDWKKGKRPDAAILAADYQELGPAGVARKYGTSRQTVYNWLDTYRLPRLSRVESEARRKAALKAVWRDPTGVH